MMYEVKCTFQPWKRTENEHQEWRSGRWSFFLLKVGSSGFSMCVFVYVCKYHEAMKWNQSLIEKPFQLWWSVRILMKFVSLTTGRENHGSAKEFFWDMGVSEYPGFLQNPFEPFWQRHHPQEITGVVAVSGWWIWPSPGETWVKLFRNPKRTLTWPCEGVHNGGANSDVFGDFCVSREGGKDTHFSPGEQK